MQNEGFMKNVFGFIFYPLSLEKRQFSSQFFFGSKRFFCRSQLLSLKKGRRFIRSRTFTHILSWSLFTPPTNSMYYFWRVSLKIDSMNVGTNQTYLRDSTATFSEFHCFFFPVFFYIFFISFMPNQEFHFGLTIIIQLFLVKCHTCVCRLTFDKNIVCHLEVFCS